MMVNMWMIIWKEKVNEIWTIGVYTFFDGTKYEGNFRNNKFHGKGVLYTNEGTVYNGTWKNGKMTGKSKIYIDFSDHYWEWVKVWKWIYRWGVNKKLIWAYGSIH